MHAKFGQLCVTYPHVNEMKLFRWGSWAYQSSTAAIHLGDRHDERQTALTQVRTCAAQNAYVIHFLKASTRYPCVEVDPRQISVGPGHCEQPRPPSQERRDLLRQCVIVGKVLDDGLCGPTGAAELEYR